MALVLRQVDTRKGLGRFDIVVAENGNVRDLVTGLEEGEYKVLTDANSVVDVTTGYRVVQDITYNGSTDTVE